MAQSRTIRWQQRACLWQTGSTAPFSMTGIINDVPLEGQGTFTLVSLNQPPAVVPPGFADFDNARTARLDFAPVPEPDTLTLPGLGGGALAVRRWWRQQG